MTPQLAIVLAGMAVGLGAAGLLAWLVPAQPQLAGALARLHPSRSVTSAPAGRDPVSGVDRVGIWLQRHVGSLSLGVAPQDLALLRIPPHRHLGRKAALALVGFALPSTVLLLTLVAGLPLPVLFPAASAVAMAGVFWLLPDQEVRSRARKARDEAERAVGAYIDLVALERYGGAGATQAPEAAAEIGDSWVFVRLREELYRARWSGQAPWDAFEVLASELDLPVLDDVAAIIRPAGTQSAEVYQALRARAASLRDQLLSEEHAAASSANARLSIPVGLLAMVFMAILAAPALLRILAESGI